MLKIIMGSDSADDILSDIGCKKKYMGLASSYFNTAKKVEWFDNELVREIVRTIDKAELVGFSAISNVTHAKNVIIILILPHILIFLIVSYKIIFYEYVFLLWNMFSCLLRKLTFQ